MISHMQIDAGGASCATPPVIDGVVRTRSVLVLYPVKSYIVSDSVRPYASAAKCKTAEAAHRAAAKGSEPLAQGVGVRGQGGVSRFAASCTARKTRRTRLDPNQGDVFG